MTPPPFSFELIVTGLCLISIQGTYPMESGAHFQFLNAPATEVCGETFEEPHVPSLTFDLDDLESGTDYDSYRAPSGKYIGVYSLTGKDLCLHHNETTTNVPFKVIRGRGANHMAPQDSSEIPAFGWVASLAHIDPKAGGVNPKVAGAIPSQPTADDLIAGRIRVENGQLSSRGLGRDRVTGDLVRWKLQYTPAPHQPKPDFPKVLAGSVALHLHGLTSSVELRECDSGRVVLSFRPENGGLVRLTAANIPQHKDTENSADYMRHFAWYERLLMWNTANHVCPNQLDLPRPASLVVSGSSTGNTGGITGSSVFCPPATP